MAVMDRPSRHQQHRRWHHQPSGSAWARWRARLASRTASTASDNAAKRRETQKSAERQPADERSFTRATRQPAPETCNSVSDPGAISSCHAASAGAPKACSTARRITAAWVTATIRPSRPCSPASKAATRASKARADSPPCPSYAGSVRQAGRSGTSASDSPAQRPRSHGPSCGSIVAPGTWQRRAGDVSTVPVRPCQRAKSGNGCSATSSSGSRAARVAAVPAWRTSNSRSGADVRPAMSEQRCRGDRSVHGRALGQHPKGNGQPGHEQQLDPE